MCPQQKIASQPQHILHIVDQLDGYGQTQQLLLLLEQQLAAGQQVRVLAFNAAKVACNALQQLGVPFRVLDRRWRRDPFAAIRLASELRRSHAELVHLWGEQTRKYRLAIQHIIPDAPAVTTLPEDITGIAPSTTPIADRQQFLSEQILPADVILIAVAGPITREQRIDEAIWNFELVRTLEERVRLIIFGDGPDRHRCERFARLAAEPPTIRFLGYREDLRALLPHADLFWHTADPSEAVPRTVLEAMSANVPVVATDSPACRQAIDHNQTGYLVPDGDRAIFARHTLQLLEDKEQAKQIAASASDAVANRFSVETMLQQYQSLYADALESNSHAHA